VLGVALLASLYAFSPIGNPIPRQPFSRNFETPFYFYKKAERDLTVNSFYIAGATEHSVYLGNQTAPLYLLRVSLPQLDTQVIRLRVKDFKMPNDFSRLNMAVDSPYFYLTHGVMPGIFKGLLSNREATNFLPVDPPYFMDAVPVSPDLLALKSLSLESNSTELATLRPDTPYFEFKSDVLVKQVDGTFCVDGRLRRDPLSGNLVYVYSYRNEYIVLDSNLNVIDRHHTIDTFSRAPIKVAQVASKGYSTLASPPVNVNLESCVSGDYLFIQSPFLSKEEDVTNFYNGSVVDTYDIKEGKYLYSFYIPHVKSHRPSSLIVTKRYMIAIFDQQLIVYEHTMNPS